MLEGNPKQKRNWHIAAASKRTRILFGEALCDFEASNGWADREGSRQLGAFQLVPTKFIETAQRRRPRNPEPTASGFAQWLYSLYSDVYGRDQDRERGKLAEQEILAERSRAFSATDNQTMRERFPDWRLVHNGMNIGKDEPPRYFEIKELSVGGQALRVLPDLIFENIDSGARIIVEVKHSYMTIPTNLWPNIWGQLWCYSQVADIKSSPSVTVVGEVWGDKTYYRGGDRCVYLRASVRRNPRASTFDQFFRVLFDIYRGACVPQIMVELRNIRPRDPRDRQLPQGGQDEALQVPAIFLAGAGLHADGDVFLVETLRQFLDGDGLAPRVAFGRRVLSIARSGDNLCRPGRTDRGLRTGRAAPCICRAPEGRAWQEDRLLVADGWMMAVLPEDHSDTRWKHGGSMRGKTAAQS